MAHPIGFAEASGILERPPSMSAEECISLEVFRDGKYVVSRWQLTDEDLEELKRNGGKVYLMILGVTMPPACVGVKSPFAKGE